MKLGRSLLRGRIPLSLFGADVDQDRLVDTLGNFNGFHNALDVVSVDRSQISDPHFFKEHSRDHQGFDRLLRAADALYDSRDRIVERIMYPVSELDVSVGSTDLVQITGYSSHIRGNGHIIVVEYYDQVRCQTGDAIERLVCKTSCHSAVSDHRHDRSLLPAQISR